MTNISSNPCTRCGKPRVDAKTWVEEIETFYGKSTITHTDTVCPDSDCQAIVQEKLDVQKLKSDTLKLEREERMRNLHKSRKPVVAAKAS